MAGKIEDDNVEFPSGKKLRSLYYDFLHDFRDYLAEYVRESVYELTIAEIPVTKMVKLFDGRTPGKAIIKNQGKISAFISTTGQGGYKLEPNESIEFFVNTQVIVTTVSGNTTLGFVKT
jgi:hypothetical protein